MIIKPGIDEQLEFWKQAVFAALAAYARRVDMNDAERAERAAITADLLTRQWLARLEIWGKGPDGAL